MKSSLFFAAASSIERPTDSSFKYVVNISSTNSVSSHPYSLRPLFPPLQLTFEHLQFLLENAPHLPREGTTGPTIGDHLLTILMLKPLVIKPKWIRAPH